MANRFQQSSPFQQYNHNRLSPVRTAQAGTKRKADEENLRHDRNESAEMDMSRSPSTSPDLAARSLPTNANRNIKRMRTNVTGRPLPLSRVLETLDDATVKNMLKTLCERHPQLTNEVAALAPKPTVPNSLSLLGNYENNVRQSFPYGGNAAGDYAYNRVKPALIELLDALSDYTPHFLPPNETLAQNSLEFLDGATNIIQRLPDWSNPVHNHHKHTAYEEITKAWVLVIREAAKRGGGISLQANGWTAKLAKHSSFSGGLMDSAMQEMTTALGFGMAQPSNQTQSRGFSNSLGFSIQPMGQAVSVPTS